MAVGFLYIVGSGDHNSGGFWEQLHEVEAI
jgi:hypothetical protein